MRNLKENFKNRTIKYDKLIDYGFNKKDNFYFYDVNILNNHFKVIINISNNTQTSKVIDLVTNDEYLLVDTNLSNGEYVGKIRDMYNNIINDIIEKCSIPDVFKSKQSLEVINYIKMKYGDDLEYLWKKFTNNAIWRNKKNNKWYGLLVSLEESKLGINSNKMVEIIDLRYSKDSINKKIDNKKYFPGYHMNKNNWITIKLDGSVNINEIYKLIDDSYNLSLKK